MKTLRTLLLLSVLAFGCLNAAPPIASASGAVLYQTGYLEVMALIESGEVDFLFTLRGLANLNRLLAVRFADVPDFALYFHGRADAFDHAATL